VVKISLKPLGGKGEEGKKRERFWGGGGGWCGFILVVFSICVFLPFCVGFVWFGLLGLFFWVGGFGGVLVSCLLVLVGAGGGGCGCLRWGLGLVGRGVFFFFFFGLGLGGVLLECFVFGRGVYLFFGGYLFGKGDVTCSFLAESVVWLCLLGWGFFFGVCFVGCFV